jgi:hypothetical protein
MRPVLCLALLMMMGVLLFSANTRPVSGCTDWDEDGVCGSSDCNDYNPNIGYNGDSDGDGLTVCQGDCDDGDPANTDKCMTNIFQVYPVFYEPPQQPCRQGYTITTTVYECDYNPITLQWECWQSYQYDTPYLRDCFPIG